MPAHNINEESPRQDDGNTTPLFDLKNSLIPEAAFDILVASQDEPF